ncbi:hypothetical protein ZWY2020_042022 [Hordeum vulgare]|nr:hypothetical protein ZWY2020_042022 [Hordeum vulgare]
MARGLLAKSAWDSLSAAARRSCQLRLVRRVRDLASMLGQLRGCGGQGGLRQGDGEVGGASRQEAHRQEQCFRPLHVLHVSRMGGGQGQGGAGRGGKTGGCFLA